jgi:hypothetical protein
MLSSTSHTPLCTQYQPNRPTCDVRHHSGDLCAPYADESCLVRVSSLLSWSSSNFFTKRVPPVSGITLEIAQEQYAKAQAAYEANLANGRPVSELLKGVQYWDAKVQALKRGGRLRTWNVTFRN